LSSTYFTDSILQITPTTIQVQFPGTTGGNLMYLEERLFKGDGHDSSGHTTTPWENAIILVSKCCSMALCAQIFKTI